LAEAEFELDSKYERNSNANLQIFMPQVNSNPDLSWQFSTFSTQN
jgi:hypothetical protein